MFRIKNYTIKRFIEAKINNSDVVVLKFNLTEALRGFPSAELSLFMGSLSTKYGLMSSLALANAMADSSGQVSPWHSQRFSMVGKQYSPSLHSSSPLHFGPQWPRAEASSYPHLESLSAKSRLVHMGCSPSSNVLQ